VLVDGLDVARVVTKASADLVGRLSDPFGNLFWVQTRIEVVDEGGIMRRMADETFTSALRYVQSSLFVPQTR
jgi:PhnB protein